MTPVTFLIALTALLFAAAVVLAVCAFLGAFQGNALEREWQEDAERRRMMLASRFTADVPVAEEPGEVTRARREFMERARLGQ